MAWCFVNRDQKFGRLVISDLATGRVLYELKRPLLADARMAFGQPAWSLDDQRLAVLYLQTSGIEEDHDAKAMLLGVDLAEGQVSPILPEPFLLYAPGSHRLRFSPEGSQVMFPKGEPGTPFDSWRHIVRFDGQELRRAEDVVYLDDGEHMVVDVKHVSQVNGDVMTGTLQNVKTGQTEALRFPVDQTGVLDRAWSVDGRWYAEAYALPYADPNERRRSAVRAMNTRLGEVHELMKVDNTVVEWSLFWVRY